MQPSDEHGTATSVVRDEPPRGLGRIGRRARLTTAVVVAAGLAVVAVLVIARDPSPPPLDRAEAGKIAGDAIDEAIEDLKAEPATSAVVYQQILPSLVQITTRSPGGDEEGSGFGTGVIVSAQGAILTALHVVDGATDITVGFVDGTNAGADVVSIDSENDIAVLAPRRTPEVIVPAVLGGSGQIGEEAYAVGHPLGFVGSLTSGVISGLDRTVEIDGGTTLRGLIQFDAAVNPGNSGGPLLNRGGQVVGIVTGLANPSDDGHFTGIGFAVPIGTAGGAANAPSK